MNTELYSKYNVPGPRYTSYPTVPYWEEDKFTAPGWQHAFKEAFSLTNATDGISLYLHLPFCESLCTFCGCNKRITKNHGVETDYLQALLKEWDLYCQQFTERPRIREIHLGGGTPTFFSARNLARIIDGIFEKAERTPDAVFGLEGHPNHTSLEQLQVLYRLGFRRISFGIQDFDPVVQDMIHRVQTFEQVQKVTDQARATGFTSINYDIIYGLPLQRLESVVDTMQKTALLKPDRIAFYSYAHVPWIKGLGQRKFTEADLPKAAAKRNLYETGRQMLEDIGYHEIGMDHFARKTDSLYQSMESGNLHRNFMGYTDLHTYLQIGLGVSSISDSWTAFAQNEKKVEDYYQRLQQNELPAYRGHLLGHEDQEMRRHILNLMCRFTTDFGAEVPAQVLNELQEPLADGLVQIDHGRVFIPEKGRPFIRNICMAFDLRLKRKQPDRQIFSMTI